MVPEKHGSGVPPQGPHRLDQMHAIVKIQGPAIYGDPVAHLRYQGGPLIVVRQI